MANEKFMCSVIDCTEGDEGHKLFREIANSFISNDKYPIVFPYYNTNKINGYLLIELIKDLVNKDRPDSIPGSIIVIVNRSSDIMLARKIASMYDKDEDIRLFVIYMSEIDEDAYNDFISDWFKLQQYLYSNDNILLLDQCQIQCIVRRLKYYISKDINDTKTKSIESDKFIDEYLTNAIGDINKKIEDWASQLGNVMKENDKKDTVIEIVYDDDNGNYKVLEGIINNIYKLYKSEDGNIKFVTKTYDEFVNKSIYPGTEKYIVVADTMQSLYSLYRKYSAIRQTQPFCEERGKLIIVGDNNIYGTISKLPDYVNKEFVDWAISNISFLL